MDNLQQQFVSIVVKTSDVRYQGQLYSINQDDKSIILQNVSSFGTEGRRPGNEIARSMKIFPYVQFQDHDIKSLEYVGQNQEKTSEKQQENTQQNQQNYKQQNQEKQTEEQIEQNKKEMEKQFDDDFALQKKQQKQKVQTTTADDLFDAQLTDETFKQKNKMIQKQENIKNYKSDQQCFGVGDVKDYQQNKQQQRFAEREARKQKNQQYQNNKYQTQGQKRDNQNWRANEQQKQGYGKNNQSRYTKKDSNQD